MTTEQNLMTTAMQEADELFLQLLKDYPRLDENDFRQESFLLCLMTNCVARLHILGWTEKELCNEVFDWSAQAREWLNDANDEE